MNICSLLEIFTCHENVVIFAFNILRLKFWNCRQFTNFVKNYRLMPLHTVASWNKCLLATQNKTKDYRNNLKEKICYEIEQTFNKTNKFMKQKIIDILLLFYFKISYYFINLIVWVRHQHCSPLFTWFLLNCYLYLPQFKG